MPPELKLDWCSHKAAKYAVEHWHYSGSLPTPPYNRVGVWEHDRFIGCVLFSRGAARRSASAFGLSQPEVVELTRVALTAHDAPVTRVLKIALRFLKSRSPGVRLIVSYADPSHGHVGGIYQAANWLYLGQQPPTTEYIGPDGKRWHSRMISPTGWKKVYGKYRRVWRPGDCRRERMPGKHKYAFALDKVLARELGAKAKPYPKKPEKSGNTCAGSVEGDAPTDQVGEGGSIPTPAL